MLKDYEFTMIVRPDLAEEDVVAVLARYEKKIADRDGSVLRKDLVGTKRFSYPIKRCFRGYYVNYDICANPAVVKDMEHQIRFDDKVLRHIIVSMDRRKSARVRDEIAAEQQRLAETQADTSVMVSEDGVKPAESSQPAEDPASDIAHPVNIEETEKLAVESSAGERGDAQLSAEPDSATRLDSAATPTEDDTIGEHSSDEKKDVALEERGE